MPKKTKIKNIIFDIGGVLFSYNDRNAVYYAVENPIHNPFEPIEHGLEILQNCFNNKNNRDIKLYVLSNWNVGPFNLLKKHYPEPFKLFDGIVISGTTGFKKPDKRIYEHLINTHNLNPEECIFIDDQIENVEMAQNLGMIGIFCSDHKTVEKKLKELGIF